jgi:TatA/E family protein of Tat protein translocase
MFGHFPELIIILGLALIVFGPEKLPEIAANAGKMIREFRDLMDSAINPRETQVPEDFTQYYYESLSRAGEPGPHWGAVDAVVPEVDGVEDEREPGETGDTTEHVTPGETMLRESAVASEAAAPSLDPHDNPQRSETE